MSTCYTRTRQHARGYTHDKRGGDYPSPRAWAWEGGRLDRREREKGHNVLFLSFFLHFFRSFFLGFRRPNLITGLSGWGTPDYFRGLLSFFLFFLSWGFLTKWLVKVWLEEVFSFGLADICSFVLTIFIVRAPNYMLAEPLPNFKNFNLRKFIKE